MLNTRKARLWAAGAVALVLAVASAGFGGWWLFIRDDAPAQASAETVAQTLDEEEAGPAGSDTTPNQLAGEWTVDPAVGTFADFTGTYVGYRIEEEFASIGAATAVGRTPEVTGGFTIEGTLVVDGSFEANMTTLQSDSDRRDDTLRTRGLETDAFPVASFELTEPFEIPADTSSGQQLDFEVGGTLTLHGVTREVTISLTAQLANGIVGINGSTPVVLADYEIEPPTNANVLSVGDQGLLEFQLFLSPS